MNIQCDLDELREKLEGEYEKGFQAGRYQQKCDAESEPASQPESDETRDKLRANAAEQEKKINELVAQLEQWEEFRRQAIPEQELLDERFCNGPKPIPPKLADLYPMTRKQFHEWREKHVENYRELESLRAKVTRMESAPYKQVLDLKVQAVIDAAKSWVRCLSEDERQNLWPSAKALVVTVSALEENP